MKKKQTTTLIGVALLAMFLLFGCIRRAEPIVYTEYTPIIISKASLAQSVKLKPPTDIIEAAKIYYKDKYIFISEQYEGVHIIDNTNPSAPINKAFIAVLGCVDMAIKNDVLYVDNAVDLVAIDLNALMSGNLKILKRVQNVFPETPPLPPDGGAIPDRYSEKNRPENTIIISWKK